MRSYINLTHPLSSKTPAYAGGKGIDIKKMKSMCDGDSCNQLHVSMTNHIGTHVDVPAHFVRDGKTITDYATEDWVFNHCSMVDIPSEPGQVINAEALGSFITEYSSDFLIIRTGFERFRSKDVYWKQSPVFHKDLGDYFIANFDNLQAIAFDCISLSSMMNRDMGREAHREILSVGIRIFEDLKLSGLTSSPNRVSAYPLLLEGADGAQVTIVGEF
jgi:arylformamidase